ncbi:MAG TPA: hypothetical protein V6C65_08575 [Allocoleopsis sp.]
MLKVSGKSQDGTFSPIRPAEPQNLDAKIFFKEAFVRKEGDSWKIGFVLEKTQGEAIQRSIQKDGKWEKETLEAGALCFFECHKGTYKSTEWKDGKATEVDTEPLPIEKFYYELFESDPSRYNAGAWANGCFSLTSNEMLLGAHNSGKWDLHKSDPIFHTFCITDPTDPVLTKDLKFPEAKGKGVWGNRPAAQTEKQRLQDRLEFLHDLVAGSEKLDAITTVLEMDKDDVRLTLRQLLRELFR